MNLDFVLEKLKKKAIWRIVLYGLLTLTFLDEPVRLFALIFFIKAFHWGMKLTDIQKYPNFLRALDGREAVYTKDLANKLGLTMDALGRKIKRLKDMDLIPKEAIFEKNGRFVLLGLQAHPLNFWMFNGQSAERKAAPQTKENKKHSDEEYLDSHPIKCPSCGAESIVKKGRTIKCPYCGRGLMVQD